MPKNFKKVETVLSKATEFIVAGVQVKPLTVISINDVMFTLPTWFACLIPVFQGHIESFPQENIVISIDTELNKFIPEVQKLFEEMFTARFVFAEYSPIHAETLIILNFLGFEDPIAIRFFKSVNYMSNYLKHVFVSQTVCTTKEYFTNLKQLRVFSFDGKRRVVANLGFSGDVLRTVFGIQTKTYNDFIIYNHYLKIIDEPVTLPVNAEIYKYCADIQRWKGIGRAHV